MRKKLLLGLALSVWAVLPAETQACGDKLVVVGRGLRPRSVRPAAQRASILLYARPGGSLPAALSEGGLRRDLERAGHRLRSVATQDELTSALGAGGFDLVFADLANAPQVEAQASEAPAHPTVLPTLYKPSPSDLEAAERQFQCVLKAPGKEKDYLGVVDAALALRARQAQPAKKR